MNKRALTTIESETFAPSSSTAPDWRRQPVSHDGGDSTSTPETRPRAALRRLIDSLALAGGGMAGVYAGVWLDPLNLSDDQTSRKDGPD